MGGADKVELARTALDGSETDSVDRARRLSLLRYSPALVLLAIAIVDTYRLADPDLWGHVLSGRLILATGHFIKTDPFNYSVPNHVWLHHEWLSEVIDAGIFARFGVLGLKLLKFACSAAVVVFVVLAIVETGASITIQLAVTLLTALAIALEMQYRPQMFSFVFFSGFVWLLTRANYGGRAPLWIGVPLLALWSNLHGGFIIGVLAIATYAAVVGTQDLLAGRGVRRGLAIGTIAVLGLAASLASPIATEAWRAIIVSFRNPLTSRVMGDWCPLISRLISEPASSPMGFYCWYSAALIGGTAILFAIVPIADDFPLVGIGALMSLAAFSATRNIAFAAIAIAPVLARRLSILATRSSSEPEKPTTPRGLTNEAVALVIAIAIAASTGLFSLRMPDSVASPAGAVVFMKSHRLHGNILNEFTWGQYLIWHMAPESKVFIDGRFDLVYPLDVIAEYTEFQFGSHASAMLLAKYPHDYVLVRPTTGAFDLMTHRSDWKLIYRDAQAALFARADSAAAKIAGVPVEGEALIDYFP
jgi:hypothetical protein